MRIMSFLCVVVLSSSGCIHKPDAEDDMSSSVTGSDAGVPAPGTGGPGGSGSVSSAGSFGLRLRLPFPAGEERTLTRGYEGTQPAGQRTTHVDYQLPYMDDRFAIDLAGDGCSSWRAPVLAAASGVVFFYGDRGYGNNSYIDHGNRCVSHYAHLDETVVREGEWVHQGQLIGYEGNTGHAEGTACPAHPGTHDHFVVMCDGVAVLPEPISGYWGLRGSILARLRSDNVGFARHPPGTLVRRAGHPEIFLVDDGGHLRWLRTEDDLRSRRLFRDFSDPFGLVVTMSEEEYACGDIWPPLDWPVTMRVTRCGGDYYLAVDDRGDRRRWWIPGTPGGDLFRITTTSWGFRESEVLDGHAGCDWPLQDASLYVRDGTILHDGAHYYYVAHGGHAYAARPEMLWALGYAPDDVLEAPTGSVRVFTRGPDPDRPELVWEDLVGCSGEVSPPMVPDDLTGVFGGFGGASIGGSSREDSDAGPSSSPDAGTPFVADAGYPMSADAGMPCSPSPESCNAFDDDCDGFVDDGNPGGGASCGSGTGSCRYGTMSCVGGSLVCVGGSSPSPEVCDGVDNDCDGTRDEGLIRSCSTACGTGTETCAAGVWGGCTARASIVETCNARDDDCDGAVDEGGVCAVCVGGSERSCTASCGSIGTQRCYSDGHDWAPCWPPAESCGNGRDDDCDGFSDEGCCIPVAEICDGRDNDCDGLTDEDGICAPPPSSGHAVRIRFAGYGGSWSFTGDLVPGWSSDVTGTVDRSWAGVTDGWYRVNGAFPGPRWMCEEWPLGSFTVPYGYPQAWVDGAPTTVYAWHDPSIEGGIGCNLRFCVGACP